MQASSQQFFRAGEVSWNKGSLINISSTIHERNTETHEKKHTKEIQRKISEYFLLDTIKKPF